MTIRYVVLSIVLLLGVLSAQTLRIFASETQQQSIRKLVDDYIAETGTQVEIELGGATTEQRTQYLSTVLTAQSGEIDIYLFDVVNPLQFAATGWVEPLNAYFESEEAMQEYLSAFLPGVVQTNLIDGTLYGIPAWTDTRFLYYRTDLLRENTVLSRPKRGKNSKSKHSPSPKAKAIQTYKALTTRGPRLKVRTAPF